MSVRHFEIYITASLQQTVVYTDHNPLTFLEIMRNENRRLQAYNLTLQEFNLKIQHIRGCDYILADTLSRCWKYEKRNRERTCNETLKYSGGADKKKKEKFAGGRLVLSPPFFSYKGEGGTRRSDTLIHSPGCGGRRCDSLAVSWL